MNEAIGYETTRSPVFEPGLRVYIASKAIHGREWQRLRSIGYPIISTWIDQSGEGETQDWPGLWDACINEASRCTRLVVYVEPSEKLKGALAEVGAALSRGIPVFIVGDPKGQGSWWRHRLCTRVQNIDEAFRRKPDHVG